MSKSIIVKVDQRGDQVVGPVRKIIGDLSDTERVLVGLDLRPAPLRS